MECWSVLNFIKNQNDNWVFMLKLIDEFFISFLKIYRFLLKYVMMDGVFAKHTGF